MIVLTLHREVPLSREEIGLLPAGCYPVMSTGDVIARAELELPVAHMIRFAVEMTQAIPDADMEAHERPSAEAGALLRAGALMDPYRTWMPAVLRQRIPTASRLSTMDASPLILPSVASLPPPEPLALTAAVVSEPEAPEAPEALPVGIPTQATSVPQMPPELAAMMTSLLSTPAITTSGAPSTALAVPTPADPAPPPPDPWALLRKGQVDAAEMVFKTHTLDAGERDRVRELLGSDKPMEVVRGCRICRLTGWKSSTGMITRVLYHNDARVRLEAVRSLSTLAGPAAEPALHMLLRDADPDVRRTAQGALNRIQKRRGGT